MELGFVDVPRWLLLGIGLGTLFSVLIAAIFALGARVFPDPARSSSGGSGGENRRREEVREYLHSIDEPFVEDHTIEGLAVDFYLPAHDVAVTFDARRYFQLERTGVHPILLEHELPGAGLGQRLPFDTPAATRRDEGGDGAFATLGLPPTASVEDVRRAYRERVKEVHPDHGGDAEAFERVRDAYAVARERVD